MQETVKEKYAGTICGTLQNIALIITCVNNFIILTKKGINNRTLSTVTPGLYHSSRCGGGIGRTQSGGSAEASHARLEYRLIAMAATQDQNPPFFSSLPSSSSIPEGTTRPPEVSLPQVAFSPPPPPPDGGWGWLCVLGCHVVHVLLGGVFSCLSLIYLELLDRYGQSSTATSWVGASFFVAMLLLGKC